MNKDIAARWVEALESGDYVQGRNVLRNAEDQFCCLGVLCDLAIAEGVVSDWIFIRDEDEGEVKDRYDHYAITDGAGRDEFTFLPDEVRKWAGMLSISGGCEADNMGPISLARLNDGGEYSFADIAAFIRENVEAL